MQNELQEHKGPCFITRFYHSNQQKTLYTVAEAST
jgi:hypothetical protein